MTGIILSAMLMGVVCVYIVAVSNTIKQFEHKRAYRH